MLMRVSQTPYVLRDLHDPLEIEALEDIQQHAWNVSDRAITPGNMLVASVHSGGIIVAAYPEGSSIPVGFAYSFPAVKDGQLLQHSHMLAIVPEHRGTGLARALKLRQRERAQELGYDRMRWTYDPLIARNARLNLGKLGAKAVSYHQDWYATQGGIYAGLPADRFMVEWDFNQPSNEHPVTSAEGPRALEAVSDDPWSPPLAPVLNLTEPVLFAELPKDIEALKRQDIESAKAWREAHRVVFPHYFARGYVITDLAAGGNRVFYRLEVL